MKIRATVPGPKDAEGKRTIKAALEVDYDFGDNLKELVSKWTEDKVYKAAIGSWVIAIQNGLRLIMEDSFEQRDDKGVVTRAAKSKREVDKEVADFLDEWTPSEKKRGKTAAEKLREQLAGMSEEERKALFADFTKGKRAA